MLLVPHPYSWVLSFQWLVGHVPAARTRISWVRIGKASLPRLTRGRSVRANQPPLPRHLSHDWLGISIPQAHSTLSSATILQCVTLLQCVLYCGPWFLPRIKLQLKSRDNGLINVSLTMCLFPIWLIAPLCYCVSYTNSAQNIKETKNKTKTALMFSTCYFLWCKHSSHGLFQALSVTSLNTDLRRNVCSQLSPTSKSCLQHSTPSPLLNDCLHSEPCFRVCFLGNIKTENKVQRNQVISLGVDAWSVPERMFYLPKKIVWKAVVLLC